MLVCALMCLAAAAWSAGCDQGMQHDVPRTGPHLVLLGANVGPDAPFSATGTIQLAFDRLLLPATVNRQSIGLSEAGGDGVTSPVITYDPVTRVVSIAPPIGGPWLVPGRAYEVTVGIPTGDDDTGGLRALDRATIDPSAPRAARKIAFVTCAATGCPSAVGTPPPAQMRFCNDVLPIFDHHCSGPYCHGTPTAGSGYLPAAGLVLQTSVGIAKTAIGRTAQGSNTGPTTRPQPPGHLFGVDMPIIAPGSPANSWLVYKMLLSVPRPTGTGREAIRPRCFPDQEVANAPMDPFNGALPFSAPFTLLGDDERARLSDFVLGNAMPYPSDPGAPLAQDENLVSFAELERIRVWIEQGAAVEECGACEP